MREEMRSHAELAALAKAQHGVVTASQMRGLGLSTSAVGRAAGARRLHRLHRGVYAVGHTAVSRQGRCLAAVLSCGDAALLSHRSAAWLWGLTARWPEKTEVTAASDRRSRDGIAVRSSARIEEVDRARHESVPVTGVPRTLLDFAAVDPWYLPQALDRASRLGLLDLVPLDELLSRSRGQRGAARLRAAIEIHRDPAYTRSGLERRFLRLVRDTGIPRPSVNCFVKGYEIDMYWPAERFAVELDTFDYHGGRGSFEADRIRQEDLKLAGIEMTRVTGTRLDREPKTVMRRLIQLLHQRRNRV